jgi:broad specificity phosphatase PhoE
MQESDLQKKEQLAELLASDFFNTVWIDYETGLSETGHQQGEKIGKIYAQLINQYPTFFPDIIYISPYLRTRLTAYYFLKNIQGLTVEFEKLINEDKLEDLIIGNFNGKDFSIKIDERIRERDHWSNIAPSFLREFKQEKDWYRKLLSEQQNEQVHYFTAPEWGESQVQTNARAKLFWKDIFAKEEYKNILVFSHHLTIIGVLLSIFGGSFQTFYKLNELRRPENGSLTLLSQIPKTEQGSEHKFRISWYNLSLEDE